MSADHPGFARLRESRRLQKQKKQDSVRLERQRRRGWWLLRGLAILDATLALSALLGAWLSAGRGASELMLSGPLLALALAAIAWGLVRGRTWGRRLGLWAAPAALLWAGGLALFGPLTSYGWLGIGLVAGAGLVQLALLLPASAAALRKSLPPQAEADSGYWQQVRARH